MTELSTALQDLLDRATAAEADAALAPDEAKAAPAGLLDSLTPDAFADLAQQAAVGSPEWHALQEQVEELQDALFALTNSTPDGEDAPAEDAPADALADDEDDEPAGMDYDEPDEAPATAVEAGELVDGQAGEFDPTLIPSQGKAAGYAPCPDCGSTGVDEYADGSPARCEDCGTVVARLEQKDYDEADDELDGVLEVIEVKADTVMLSEMELLQARREALEQ
jgi:hypothetical protein